MPRLQPILSVMVGIPASEGFLAADLHVKLAVKVPGR